MDAGSISGVLILVLKEKGGSHTFLRWALALSASLNPCSEGERRADYPLRLDPDSGVVLILVLKEKGGPLYTKNTNPRNWSS